MEPHFTLIQISTPLNASLKVSPEVFLELHISLSWVGIKQFSEVSGLRPRLWWVKLVLRDPNHSPSLRDRFDSTIIRDWALHPIFSGMNQRAKSMAYFMQNKPGKAPMIHIQLLHFETARSGVLIMYGDCIQLRCFYKYSGWHAGCSHHTWSRDQTLGFQSTVAQCE